eukprot:368289_1
MSFGSIALSIITCALLLFGTVAWWKEIQKMSGYMSNTAVDHHVQPDLMNVAMPSTAVDHEVEMPQLNEHMPITAVDHQVELEMPQMSEHSLMSNVVVNHQVEPQMTQMSEHMSHVVVDHQVEQEMPQLNVAMPSTVVDHQVEPEMPQMIEHNIMSNVVVNHQVEPPQMAQMSEHMSNVVVDHGWCDTDRCNASHCVWADDACFCDRRKKSRDKCDTILRPLLATVSPISAPAPVIHRADTLKTTDDYEATALEYLTYFKKKGDSNGDIVQMVNNITTTKHGVGEVIGLNDAGEIIQLQ